MIVEVGKKYRGLINGYVFTLRSPKNKEDKDYLVAVFLDGREFQHNRSFFEHLLIEEVVE